VDAAATRPISDALGRLRARPASSTSWWSPSSARARPGRSARCGGSRRFGPTPPRRLEASKGFVQRICALRHFIPDRSYRRFRYSGRRARLVRAGARRSYHGRRPGGGNCVNGRASSGRGRIRLCARRSTTRASATPAAARDRGLSDGESSAYFALVDARRAALAGAGYKRCAATSTMAPTPAAWRPIRRRRS